MGLPPLKGGYNSGYFSMFYRLASSDLTPDPPFPPKTHQFLEIPHRSGCTEIAFLGGRGGGFGVKSAQTRSFTPKNGVKVLNGLWRGEEGSEGEVLEHYPPLLDLLYRLPSLVFR